MSEAQNQILEMLDSIEDAVNLDSWSERSPPVSDVPTVHIEAAAEMALSHDLHPTVMAPIFEATLRRYPDAEPKRTGVTAVRGTTAQVLSAFCWNADK